MAPVADQRQVGARIVRLLVQAALGALIALGLVRLLYTTHYGVALLDSVPDAPFSWFASLWSAPGEQLTEDRQDLDALFVFVCCWLLSVIVLRALEGVRARLSSRGA